MGSDIEKIISNYLAGELSKEEEIKLNRWLDKKTSNRDQLDLLTNVWKTPVGYPHIVNADDQQNKIWSRLQNGNMQQISQKVRSNSRMKIFLRYAAILFLFLSLGYIFWNSPSPNIDNTVVSKVIERNNPLGQKSRIHLPDGSVVWLNAGSNLTYSSDFNNETRKIWLSGEAFFEVAKNPDIPFEVFTNDLVITALGTSFNVNAFNNKKEEKIALNSGAIKVECLDSVNRTSCSPKYLIPGELVLYNGVSGKIEVVEFGDQDLFGWKDGRIVFNHATFNEVLEVLERWYNVEIQVSGKLNQEWDYSTTFENEILENVLASLMFTEKIDYELNGLQVKIKL